MGNLNRDLKLQGQKDQNLVQSLPEPLRNLSKYSVEQLLVKAENELDQRKETDGLTFYKPNLPCQRIIEGLGSGGRFISILSTANGLGKTTFAANLLGNIIWGPQNKYFDYPVFRNWPFPKRLRFVTDPKLLEEIGPFHTEVHKWWPKGKFEAIKGGHSYYSQYKANGFVVDVMSTKQEREQHEGVTLGLLIPDEPPPQSLWSSFISRFRMGGMIVVVMTPLVDAAWFYDQVVPKHQNAIVYGSMEDACIQHGTNGHLEHSNIQNQIANMPSDEVEARVYGKAMYLRGLIFKTFDPTVHVLSKDFMPPKGSAVVQVVDPHDDKPFAVIWAYKVGPKAWHIFDEWPHDPFQGQTGCQLTILDYKKIFSDVEAPYRVPRRVIDRHFADRESSINRKTLRQELRSIGLNYYPSYTAQEEVQTGILRVREGLKYITDKPITAINKPKLTFNPRCKNTIKAFQRWTRDPVTGKPLDAYKDFVDVVRYLVMDDPDMDSKLPVIQYQKPRYG